MSVIKNQELYESNALSVTVTMRNRGDVSPSNLRAEITERLAALGNEIEVYVREAPSSEKVKASSTTE